MASVRCACDFLWRQGGCVTLAPGILIYGVLICVVLCLHHCFPENCLRSGCTLLSPTGELQHECRTAIILTRYSGNMSGTRC